MKKLIILFAAFAICASVYAQTDTTYRQTSAQELDRHQNQNLQTNPADRSLPDGIIMQDGKVMQVKDGKMTALDNDLTLSNGTRITRDGSWTDKDGSKKSMKDGEHMDMSGKVNRTKRDKDRNMYLVTDSVRRKDF